jgi:hypothetical protein
MEPPVHSSFAFSPLFFFFFVFVLVVWAMRCLFLLLRTGYIALTVPTPAKNLFSMKINELVFLVDEDWRGW